jgi:pimeloyl-ACP methyl ester carboxylesterase
MAPAYDRIGLNYAELRRPCPRTAEAIEDALGTAETVLNVGAGTGSYEPVGRRVTAVEPSREMIRSDAHRPTYLAQAMRTDRDVAGRLFQEVAEPDLPPRLPAISGPVTVLYVSAPNIPIGDDKTDSLYRAAYRGLPEVSLKRIDESYHFIMLDQPARFAQEVRDFLK